MGVFQKTANPALVIGLFVSLLAGKAIAQNTEILLWPQGAPLANGTISTSTASVDRPSITAYPATNPNGAAIIVFPGGGYSGLATSYEGTTPAKFFASKGVAGFVVKYRLGPTYHHPVEMWDAQRAIRWVKSNAAKYGIDTSRVGVLGFSAGGHLASTVSTHYDAGNSSAADSIDKQSCRPAFSVLAYPVITMNQSFTHGGSRTNLLGNNPSQALVDSLSNEKQVADNTPPAFLFHSKDDGVVPIRNSKAYYDSCLKKGVPASFMIFDKGGHGYGMADGKEGAALDPVLNTWCDSSVKWLDKQGLFKPKTTALIPSARGHLNRSAPRDLSVLPLQGLDVPTSDALGRRPKGMRAALDGK